MSAAIQRSTKDKYQFDEALLTRILITFFPRREAIADVNSRDLAYLKADAQIIARSYSILSGAHSPDEAIRELVESVWPAMQDATSE